MSEINNNLHAVCNANVSFKEVGYLVIMSVVTDVHLISDMFESVEDHRQRVHFLAM